MNLNYIQASEWMVLLMKYMTFNSSCSYAGIANMLMCYDFNVEDYEIAVGIDLPYLLQRNHNEYLSGPMLQTKKWFDIFLKKYGYELIENKIKKEDVFSYLIDKKCAMLGIKIDEQHKHAVVFTKIENDQAIFINNKRRESKEPDQLILGKEELLNRLDAVVVVSYLKPCRKEIVSTRQYILESIQNLDSLKETILDYCSQIRSRNSILSTMNTLFRPILLDSISVLEMINATHLVANIKIIQGQYTKIILKDKLEEVKLGEYLDMDLFQSIFEDWKNLMYQKINK